MEAKKKKRIVRITLIALVIALLAGACFYGIQERSMIKGTVASLKSSMRDMVSAISSGETERANAAAEQMKSDVDVLRSKLASPLFKLLGALPTLGDDIASAEKLCAIMDDMTDTLIRPTIAFFNENPVKSLTTGSGINSAAADAFLAYYQQLTPALEKITNELGGINLAVIDPDGKINAYLNAFGQLSELLGTVSTDAIGPLRAQLAVCPLDNIKVGDGFDIHVINSYLDFLDGFIPGCRDLADKLKKLELGELDANGTVAGYTDALQGLIDMYDNNYEYIDLARTFLGDGSDRTYLIGAQNTSEIYSAGGFPGSMGLVSIRNGVLSIGDFISVYDMITDGFGFNASEQLTGEEQSLFPGMIGYPWDAGYCPDFERVAEIWNGSFYRRHGEELNGIVSLTPAIIGRLLPYIGELELSEGTILTAENATSFLQYEIYAKYINTHSDTYMGPEFCDRLFAEVARKSMSGLVQNFSVANIPGYISVLEEAIADRTLMLWFKDESEQDVARTLKCSGNLSHDPNAPQIGLFVGVVDACKMGWWIDIDYTLSEPTVNEDGSRSYELRATFGNGMKNGEGQNYSWYITGGGYGESFVQATITGPAGGSITNVNENGRNGWNTGYQGLPIFTIRDLIYPEDQIIIDCTVTTAPGVETPPEIIRTPTLTEYRLAFQETREQE